MKTRIYHMEKKWMVRVAAVVALLQSAVLGSQFSVCRAQEVSVDVSAVQQVLPPQAGQYVDNPGKFFTVKLTNNTDEEQRLHMGMHIDMTYPDEQVMVVTPYGHIPRQPIVLAPRQSKILNPIEMKLLFTHFELDEIYIRDGLYNDYKRGIFGLLPEGQYKLYMQAYKWDPEITSAVQLNTPDNGLCRFTVCYTAQAPVFLTPTATINNDPLSMLSVSKLDINAPTITWTQPTLNCNPTLYPFTYSVKIVRLDDLMPDEAIEKNPIEYVRDNLTTTTLTIPSAYVTKMYETTKADKNTVYAMQVTARNSYASQNGLNFTLIENDGKSPVLLFRMYDPKEQPDATKSSAKDGKVEEDSTELYVFEQPTLTKPVFSSKTARKVFMGDSIVAEWRKAWFAGGKGEKQDTVKFEYTVALYKGNSADTPEGIFTSKPIYENKTTELTDTIKWAKIKDKVQQDDYLMLRITAKSTNEKSIRMHGDSLNYRDFVMTQHFDVDYSCGTNTADISNKEPIKECPKGGTLVTIGDWTLELGSDVKQDDKTKGLNGTGFIMWTPGPMKIRVAVKFENLMVNSDMIVYDGVCNTYPDPNAKKFVDTEYTAQQAVDSLFSDWGLDNIWGDIGLPSNLADKVTSETGSLAEKYNLGDYYSYFKQAEKQWDKWKAGNWLDLYFPTELPDTIASLLPEDFSLQIASIIYTPKAAVMNVIGEFVLPKVDVIKNEVLIFGAPRLCIQKDRFLPEDGTLALLSNFTIKDPDSDFDMTFKAPSEPLRPNDGCYIQWEDDSFGGLGIEVAMHIPNLDRVVDGKVQKNVAPLCDLKATIENTWGDWMGKITMDAFQVRDLPGWTFTPGNVIIYDHSYERNDKDFPLKSIADAKQQYGDTFDPTLCGTHVKTDWNAWQGLYIDEISVQFPKWSVFGSGEQGFKVSAERMLFDGSGCSLDIAALNIMEAKTGKAGGWEFDLDSAVVHIVQNNFDNCHITGRFGVPLFGVKSDKSSSSSSSRPSGTSGRSGTSSRGSSSKSSSSDDSKVHFTCDIRHLSQATGEKYYTYVQKFDDKNNPIAGEYDKIEHERHSYGDKDKYAYLFRTTQVNDLSMDCFVADLSLDKNQTYFALAAEDQDNGETITHLELSIGGDITIANAESANAKLAKISKNLPMKLRLPGIHFTKMYVSNFKRSTANAQNNMIFKYDAAMGNLEAKRQQAETDYWKEHDKLKTLRESKEIELSKACYLDFGEWSLASMEKKIGPFKFSLDKYNFNYSQSSKQLSLDITGSLGLCGDVVNVTAGIGITSTLTMPSDYTDLSGYSLSDGEVKFKSLALDLDFTALHMKGQLDVVEDGNDKGYSGSLDIDIVGLFGVKCKGGYYQHDESATNKEKQKLKDEAKEAGETYDPENEKYAWGYFTCEIESDAGIRCDPLVINRIAGGFFFNARPTYDSKTKKFGDPKGEYGCIGIQLGIGLETSAGKETLNGDLDLTVVYNRKAKCLSTFNFIGQVHAVSGIINAKMNLLYENTNTDRYLQLDITVETGIDMGSLAGKITNTENVLAELKSSLDDFQSGLSSELKGMANEIRRNGVNGGLTGMLDDDGDHEKAGKSENTGKLDKKAAAKADASKNGRFGQATISFQLKVTWREKGQTKSPVRWHLYLGEPDKTQRCKVQLIDYKSPGGIIKVDIGADGYLCIGNELPGNGQLPPIPDEITDFLTPKGVDTGADMAKAQRSRKAAMQAMLPTGDNVKGGLMVGASAWGFIDINLGLFYGGLKAIAGFDMSLVKYDPAGYCANLKRSMGKNGWYAQGQFYAYLAAKFGLHIKLGKLVDKKIDIVDAGIGGVFQAGLPSPTWIDGRARVKMRLLAGLVNINKTFHFECGDYCEAFMGNALDGFSLFGDLTIGSDSCSEGWSEQNAILPREANRAIFTTEASLNSQYRLVDPSTQNALASENGLDPSEVKLNAARTYVFDMDRNKNGNLGKIGARLYEFDKNAYSILKNEGWVSYKSRRGTNIRGRFDTEWSGTVESNIEMKNHSLTSTKVKDDKKNTDFNDVLNRLASYEVPVSVREQRGTRFHLNMALKSDCYYMLVLTGTGFEVENGQCYWPTITEKNSKGKYESHYYNWIQHKFYYFRTQSEAEIPSVIEDLSPYVALAYPSNRDGNMTSILSDGDYAYYEDLARPTIALNRDISSSAFQSGTLNWELTSTNTKTKQTKTEKFVNDYVKSGTNYVNMKPKYAFTPLKPEGGATASQMQYNLKLSYTYKVRGTCEETWYKYPSARGGFVIVDLDGNDPEYGYAWRKWGYDKSFLNSKGWLNHFDSWVKKNGKDRTQLEGDDAGYKLLHNWFTNYYVSYWESTRKALEEYKNSTQVPHTSACMKDTTIYLADWWFRGMRTDQSWQTMGSSYSAKYNVINNLMPYEAPFVGVSSASPPEYYYDSWDGYKLSSVDFLDEVDTRESIYQTGKTDGYRLYDPYLYFAYLSNWVFIGGVKMKSYSFDDVEVRHATETLTFSYNGIDVQGSAQIEGMVKSMYDVRRSMYNTWNNWYYGDATKDGNDWYQPRYPLPTGLTEAYDATIANQDGKAATYRPTFAVKSPNNAYPYYLGARDYIKDFMAPYYIAETLCDKMKEIADDIYSLYLGYWKSTDKANDKLKEWSSLHRGQYLTVESRGFSVRVPYYQFPLIFGDCFGYGSGSSQGCEYGSTLDRSKRSFSYSLGTKLSNDRWETPTSNLLFFRLRGGFPFRTWSKNTLSKKYNASRKGNYYWVSQDKFEAKNALQRWVDTLPMRIYRCNSYNMNNGQYYYWSGVGASGDSFKEFTFDPLNDKASPTRFHFDTLVDYVGKPDVLVNGGDAYNLENDIDVKEGGVK